MLSLLWIGSIVGTVIIASNKRLNMAGYVLFAVILGPVALIAALLEAPVKKDTADFSGPFTIEDAKRQMAHIRHMIDTLTEQTDKIESKLKQLTGAPINSIEKKETLPPADNESKIKVELVRPVIHHEEELAAM